MLLHESGLRRIVEFFAAEKGGGGTQRSKRKDFMKNMQSDWDARRQNPAIVVVFGSLDEAFNPPPVREIWFEPVKQEMRLRGVAPHDANDFVDAFGEERISIGCENCQNEVGWQA
jgi:hypothetical protein